MEERVKVVDSISTIWCAYFWSKFQDKGAWQSCSGKPIYDKSQGHHIIISCGPEGGRVSIPKRQMRDQKMIKGVYAWLVSHFSSLSLSLPHFVSLYKQQTNICFTKLKIKHSKKLMNLMNTLWCSSKSEPRSH